MQNVYLSIVLAPLAGAVIAGLFRNRISRGVAHWVAILGVAASTVLSLYVLYGFVAGELPVFNANIYTWATVGGWSFHIGFLIDHLSALMMAVVSFISLMVHIYTIGYMAEDPGYKRFFSYIALFTFSMLMLVMSNNFVQLFFGWEAVGLVSYLLIGFWFKRDSATFANLKAFLVNRVGDFGFLLGIAVILAYFGSLDYVQVFAAAGKVSTQTITVFADHPWSVLSLAAILLFVGAMAKSAQVPLHVWLPDSMEGPTPISALIHAATMVTAGIFMVARMSPIFEYSETALSVVLVIGAITAFFTGLIGLVQTDIKRVIAYSTLSQLGYMTVALGASAYSIAIFHLMTHAFFKALLFLGAGSVIIAMHHEQDMRSMGGLRKYMPITFITMWVGTLALIGFPGTAGFFSKDLIIEAVAASHIAGSTFAYWSVLLGVLITSLYSFRLLYLTFYGAEHMDAHTREQLSESPWVVWVPLVMLAIPSLLIGWLTVRGIVFGDFLSQALFVLPGHEALATLAEEFHGPGQFALHGLFGAPFWLAVAGFAIATYVYRQRPELAHRLKDGFGVVARILENKYGFDDFNQTVFARGAMGLGRALWRGADATLIDGALVNGSARSVGWASQVIRQLQSGYLFHYAFIMILGLLALLGFFVLL